jgi:hypothetical protein
MFSFLTKWESRSWLEWWRLAGLLTRGDLMVDSPTFRMPGKVLSLDVILVLVVSSMTWSSGEFAMKITDEHEGDKGRG